MIDEMWIWGAIGLVLLTIEMGTGTIYILWFGIAALCVSIATWIIPNMPVAVQLVLFTALAISSLAIWRLNYKSTETHSRVGQAQGEEIGRIGTVTEPCSSVLSGKILFTQGLMGSRDWPAIANKEIAVGEKAQVIAVEGNTLRIEAV